MKRKDFTYPTADDLVVGNVLPIYIKDFMQEEGFEGNAELIEPARSLWRDPVPYIRAEIGGTDKQFPNSINWSFQRWLVKFVDGPNKGLSRHRYIAHFLSIEQFPTSNYSHFDEE